MIYLGHEWHEGVDAVLQSLRRHVRLENHKLALYQITSSQPERSANAYHQNQDWIARYDEYDGPERIQKVGRSSLAAAVLSMPIEERR